MKFLQFKYIDDNIDYFSSRVVIGLFAGKKVFNHISEVIQYLKYRISYLRKELNKPDFQDEFRTECMREIKRTELALVAELWKHIDDTLYSYFNINEKDLRNKKYNILMSYINKTRNQIEEWHTVKPDISSDLVILKKLHIKINEFNYADKKWIQPFLDKFDEWHQSKL